MANHHGTLFAGQGLQLLAKAAFLAARSLAQREVVMAAVTSVDFFEPVPVGCELALHGWVSRVGRSSLTVCVSGTARRLGAPCKDVLKGVFQMVAVDSQGRPAAVDCRYMNPEAIP
ncbi:Thioesterase superfamily protein [Paracidovorax konjaci]|uniref:Thioesterase superfamily protein n=2 Tax=Paracidovorax konjaci TaxID=32040 RepID=A0A1I1WI60_9BURK|nr:Thioesterase superfamily protein [Paracidovorax konjaci]